MSKGEKISWKRDKICHRVKRINWQMKMSLMRNSLLLIRWWRKREKREMFSSNDSIKRNVIILFNVDHLSLKSTSMLKINFFILDINWQWKDLFLLLLLPSVTWSNKHCTNQTISRRNRETREEKEYLDQQIDLNWSIELKKRKRWY